MMIPQRGGLPHSDIHGSKPARGSPWLFAACHVLHRLLVPRHPPNALLTLHTSRQPSVSSLQKRPSNISRRQAEASQPCTETIAETPALLRHSATQTPLNTAAASGGTILGRTHAPPQSLPVRQITQCRNGPPLSQSKPTHARKPRPPPSCPARPETHQNQIHNTKEQHTRPAPAAPRSRGQTSMTEHKSILSARPHTPMPARPAPTPSICYGDYRIRTDDPLLAKQVLYQLS